MAGPPSLGPVLNACRLPFPGAGPVEASSHVETTLTQLVQEVTIAAQAGKRFFLEIVSVI